jgi:hypothetical protein
MSIGAVIIGQGGKGSSSGGGGGTVTQGPAGLITAPWFVELSDGTNQQGTSAHPIRIDPTGTTVQPVDGALTHNNAAPAANNIGALVALANAAAPTYTEGDQVLLSTDLSGVIRANTAEWGGTVVSAAAQMPPTAGALVGTETAPYTRPIFRKWTQTLLSGSQSSSTAYTSSWFDTNTDGRVTLHLEMYPTAAITSWSIDVTDNFSVTITNIFNTGLPVNGTAFQAITIPIPARYWRIHFNSSNAQGANFLLTATVNSVNGFITGSANLPLAQNATGVISVGVINSATFQSEGTGMGPWTSFGSGNGAIPGVVSMVASGAPNQNGVLVASRAPTTFANAQATSSTSAATNVQLVAGVAAQKIRLLKFKVQVTGLAAAASATDTAISIIDGASTPTGLVHYVTLPASALTLAEDYDSGWIDLGPIGYVSAATGNALSFQTSVKLSAGTINVIVAYCGPAASV